MYEPPRQLKWFVGLQIFDTALGTVLVFVVANDLGWEIGLKHFIFVLFIYLVVRSFFIWKVWSGKNWARLTILAWFLYTYLQYIAQRWSGSTPIQIDVSLKALIAVVAVLQATSLELLFTRPANQWFRTRAKQSLLFPR